MRLVFRRMILVAALACCACGPARPYPSSIRDDLGREVALQRPAGRVVTLAPNLTEMVFAAGLGGRIVGTDDASNFPPAARRLSKVGGVTPSVEKIVSLRPDLVLGLPGAAQASTARSLASADIPLYCLRTDRLADIPRAIREIASLLGEPDRGTRAAAAVERAVASQRRSRLKKPRVLFLVWAAPLYVGGRQTYIDDLLALTGAENAVAVQGWPEYSLESVLASPPDLILFPERAVSQRQMEAIFHADSRWRELACVRAGHYAGVDDDVFTRPGPRVAQAAAALDSILARLEIQR